MEIKNFTYEGMSLGNIEIKDVAVAATKATDASAAYKSRGNRKAPFRST